MGPLDGLPTWVKSVAFVGFPAFIAVFLLAQNAGLIGHAAADTAQIAAQIAQHDEKLDLMVQSLNDHRMRQEELLRTVKVALKVMCENSAFTVAQKNNCQNIR